MNNPIENLDISTEAQAKRRLLLSDLIYRDLSPCIHETEKGTTVDRGKHGEDSRLTLWIARAMLASNERRKLGNKLLASVTFNGGCHFSGVASMGLLVKNGSQLTVAARENLEAFVLRNISDWMTEDYRFFGANDNAPFGCNGALSLAGQYFDRPVLVKFARERYRQLCHLLDMRGYVHECNSPTYTGISLLAVADLSDLSKDEETRAMTLRIEHRLWQEMFLHLHPLIRGQMGPYSRFYPHDGVAHDECSFAMVAIYCACGEISPFNPVQMLFSPTVDKSNLRLFHKALSGGMSAVTFHPPLELVKSCLERKMPFSVRGSNEFMPIGGTPCGQTNVQVYGEKEWALSSFGSRLWAGQTVSLHAVYQRHAPGAGADTSEHQAAVRGVFTRFHISENFGSMQLRDRDKAMKEVSSDHAAAFVVQHQGTALLGYVPVAGPEKTQTMKASVVFPLHHSRPDEIWHGQDQIAGFSASFNDATWAFVRDGDIYLAFYPLVARQENQMLCTQQYSDYGEYGMISFFNMSAFTSRPMEEKERRSFGSGLVMEISCRRLEGTFEKFREKMSRAKITHRQYGTQRDLSYLRDGIDLELIYDFEQLNLRRAAVNGSLVSRTTKLEAKPDLPLIV